MNASELRPPPRLRYRQCSDLRELLLCGGDALQGFYGASAEA